MCDLFLYYMSHEMNRLHDVYMYINILYFFSPLLKFTPSYNYMFNSYMTVTDLGI